MYSSYYLIKETNELIGPLNHYSDDFKQIYNAQIDKFDRYSYLIQMYQIVASCSEDFINYIFSTNNDFWIINKYLLAFVNAIYSYKEYVTNYFGYHKAINSIPEEHYQDMGWYRFICEYRNKIIHQTAVIKHWNPETHETYINLDEFISYNKKLLEKEHRKRENTQRFVDFLENLNKGVRLFEGERFLLSKYVVYHASNELYGMHEDILMNLWDKEIASLFEWLISLIYKEGDQYRWTYGIENQKPESKIDITREFETYLIETLLFLGPEAGIPKRLLSFLDRHNYSYLFTQSRSVEDVVEASRQSRETVE